MADENYTCENCKCDCHCDDDECQQCVNDVCTQCKCEKVNEKT